MGKRTIGLMILALVLALSMALPAFAHGNDHHQPLPDPVASVCLDADGHFQVGVFNDGGRGYIGYSTHQRIHTIGFMDNGDAEQLVFEHSGQVWLWVRARSNDRWQYAGRVVLDREEVEPCEVPDEPVAEPEPAPSCAVDIVNVATAPLAVGVDINYSFLGEDVDVDAYLETMAAETAAGVWVDPQVYGVAGQSEAMGKFAVVINPCLPQPGYYLAFVPTQPLVLYRINNDGSWTLFWLLDSITLEG